MRLCRELLVSVLVIAAASEPAGAYSQFTHEELIDLLWADSIRPLLVQRYPATSEAALREAHAFAYGGSLTQDIGYYPFGNRFFSNLAHYVRSGDFVVSMFREAHSVNELAFAIGALSHYVGDSIGHSQAVNPSTAEEFPKLEAKYGAVVTYEEAPLFHVRTEFGFDVTQAALQRYAPDAYRRHFGFRVARPLLYRAFRDIYGISARGILGPARTALSTYRWSVARLLPAFLHAEMVRLGGRLPTETADAAQAEFLEDISRADYATQYADPYYRPGVRAHLLAVVVAVLPKIGRLKVLEIQPPLSSTEDLFLESADRAVESLREALARMTRHTDGSFQLINLDLDTGRTVAPGQSRIVDDTYAKLLLRIVQGHVAVSPELRKTLVDYYSDPNHQPPATHDPNRQRKIERALASIREAR